jgi:hypothetical protein
MQTYTAPLRDMRSVLHELPQAGALLHSIQAGKASITALEQTAF